MHGQTKSVMLKLTYMIIHWLLLSCCVAIHIWCIAALNGRHICFMVNCKSSCCAISTLLVCMACANVITTISSVALSPKYLCIDICMNIICVLCCHVAIVQCHVVDIYMSVCLFGVLLRCITMKYIASLV